MPNIISTASAVTVKKEDLVIFLQEIDAFISKMLPNLYEECSGREGYSTKVILDGLCKELTKENADPYAYALYVDRFAKHVRNCAKMRTSHIGTSKQVKHERISIKSWLAENRNFKDFTKEELLLIAEKLLDEAFLHLSEILLEIVCSGILKNLAKKLKKRRTLPRYKEATA